MPKQLLAVQYLDATDRDADSIASLHVDSWRRHYRVPTWTHTLMVTSSPIAKRCGEVDWPSPTRVSSRGSPVTEMSFSVSPTPSWMKTNDGDHFLRTSTFRVT